MRVREKEHPSRIVLPVCADTLGAAWLTCIKSVLDVGWPVSDDGETLREICGLTVDIETVAEDDPIIRSLADQERISLQLCKYESLHRVSHYKISYGKLLYANQGVDQVEFLIAQLKKKPETKAATIGLHFPGQRDLSCLSLLDCKIRDSALHLTAVYRSQNVFGSQVGNALALRRIQERVAQACGVPCGRLRLVILSAHIYEKDVAKACDVLRRAESEKLDRLSV